MEVKMVGANTGDCPYKMDNTFGDNKHLSILTS